MKMETMERPKEAIQKILNQKKECNKCKNIMVGGTGEIKWPTICGCNYHDGKTIDDYIKLLYGELYAEDTK